ncbi:MAG: choice-of-anchor L domain-containing protein, partial [Flavobacteriales bacterium]|nr:choice-of-anchor L domain-containing protein [Flavobacteriales bacterium]
MLRWRSLHALVLALWTGCSLSAQLVVGTALTPAQVVQGVLLGPGVTASNIQFLGDPDQLGTFIGVNSNIGLDSGMVMCTGDINVAPGPNMQGGATLGGGNQTGDPDLDAIIAPYFSRDRAVLEFDFIATGDSVRFTFIFASEEYNEYVCTAKNDVFGFFLSGPGINGPFLNNAENIALVPGTSVPVQINTVNIGAAGSAGGNPANCAAADPNWQANSVYFVDNANGATVEFDGFTVPLVAAAQVICGQQYHIKLAIADADDTVFDSAVFIEAGSFQSNAIDVSTQILAGGVDSVLYEGCGEAELILVRAGLLQTEDTVFLSTSGQAVAGTDYSAILSEVVFPVGVDSAIVPISALQDGLPEGIEQAIITAITQGDCGADTALIVFYVDDAPAIDILMAADTMVACPGDSALVQASVSGGFGMRQLSWNTGLAAGDNAAWVSPAQTTTYVLSVTDDCGQVTAVDSMTVTVPEPDPLVITAIPDTLVFCPESPVLLEAVVQGGTPGFQYAWSNGLGNAPT